MGTPHASDDAHPLDPYGWNGDLAAAFSAHPDLTPARLARVDRGRGHAVTADGPVAADLAPLRTPDPVETPCTGDWVGLADGPTGPVAALRLPRRTALVRAVSSRRSEGQIIAANADTVLITVGLDVPVDIGRLTRLAAIAWDSGALPLLALTKIDCAPDADHMRADAEAAAPGIEVLLTSTVDGAGLDTLAARLAGGTAALVGQSGAGKSSLVNALTGRQAMAVQQVRSRDGKGRHTTVTRELVPLPGGGLIMDTPGLRGVGMFGSEDGLRRAFSDVTALAEQCRFGDCAHGTEPGCAINAALASGELTERRMTAYRKLARESEYAAARAAKRRMREARTGRPRP